MRGGRYQGRVEVIEEPMLRKQPPLDHGGSIFGMICSLPTMINLGVLGVLLITAGIIMIVFAEHGNDLPACAEDEVSTKKNPHLLPGGIACLVIGVICLLWCLSLIIYITKKYKSMTSSSHLRRHVIHCTPPYRDEDQLSNGRYSRVHTAGSERKHGLAPKRWPSSSRSHTLNGHVLEYPTSQNITPVGYTNGTSRAPSRYLRSTAVYPSQYPTSERQRFSYVRSSNGQPFYYDFPKDGLDSRQLPSFRRSTYPQSPFERPSRIFISPSEQQSRYHPPTPEVASDNRTLGEQPLHNLTREKISSNLRFPPSVGKNFAYYDSSNGQRLYYDFSTGEVLSQRLHSNGEATRIQPSSMLTSNNPVIDEQPAHNLSERPLSPPPPPGEQILHISHSPEEESLRTSHFAGDPQSVNIPTHDGDHSINPLAEIESSSDTTLPNEGPLPKYPSPDEKTSQYVPSPDGEPSDDNHAPNNDPSDNTLAPDEEPSSNTSIPVEETSINTTAPTEEPLGDTTAPDEEPSSNESAPDAEESNNSPAPDEEASSSTARSEGDGSINPLAPNEEPSGSTPTPDKESLNNIPAPDNEPSSNTPDPEKEPSSDTPAAEKEPSSNIPDPEEELSSNGPAPEEVPSNNVPIPKEELSNNVPVPEGEPSNNVPVPEDEPSNNVPVPEEKPSNNVPVPEEEPSNNVPVPEEEPSNNVPVPEEEPSNNVPVPEEEPSNNIPVPEEESSNNVPVPEESTSNKT